MTTILCHRDVMYADSRCTVDGVHFPMQKIHAVRQHVIACAGESFAREEFLQQFQVNTGLYSLRVPEGIKIKDRDFSALVIAPGGHLYHFDHRFACDFVDGIYMAIGTGQEAVLGAIEAMKLLPVAGVDPMVAMRAACAVDVANSGGPIQWMKLGEFVLHKDSV